MSSRRRERGQALVETALLLPVFVLVLIVIFDLGRAVYGYSTIGNAARSAGRVAIVNQDLGEIQSRAVAESIALGVTNSDVSVCYEEADSTLRRCPAQPGNTSSPCATVEIGCLALVEVRYSFAALTPLVGNIVGPITLSSTTVLPVEHVPAAPTP